MFCYYIFMRYFDRTFFKFTLGFLFIVAVSLLIMYATSAYASGVEKIVFVTKPQIIKPGERSGPIKIEFRNSEGKPQSFGEKLELILNSFPESDTGAFLNEKSGDVSTSISSSYSSRTFYYRDSTEGTFTITASIDGKNLSASQQITVSSGASQNNSSSNSSENSEILEEKGESTTNVSTPVEKLEVVAGSDRVATQGSPIWFQATIKKNTISNSSLEFSWSFGDGNVGVGSLVSHTYKYAGDYAVVLSAKAGDIFSVSRLKVKVAEPDISVLDKGEYLEITNNSNSEINLFNWKIENKGKGFIFQPNTIILPKSSIKLDKNLLTMKGLDNSQEIRLKNSMGQEIFKKEFPVPISIPIVQNKIINKVENAKNEVKNIEKVEIATSTENIENIIYEAPKQEGFLAKLTNFIKGVFFR